MNSDIMSNMAAIIAGIRRPCCTVEPTLTLPMNFGTSVPPSRPIENTKPSMLPYRLGSNLQM